MLQGVAEDPNDRLLAMAVWAGIVAGGPLIALGALVVKWSHRGSLARRHAVTALWMYGVTFVVYVPAMIWTFGFGGPMAAFWVVWAATVLVVLSFTVVGIVGAMRSTVTALPPPPAPAVPTRP